MQGTLHGEPNRGTAPPAGAHRPPPEPPRGPRFDLRAEFAALAGEPDPFSLWERSERLADRFEQQWNPSGWGRPRQSEPVPGLAGEMGHVEEASHLIAAPGRPVPATGLSGELPMEPPGEHRPPARPGTGPRSGPLPAPMPGPAGPRTGPQAHGVSSQPPQEARRDPSSGPLPGPVAPPSPSQGMRRIPDIPVGSTAAPAVSPPAPEPPRPATPEAQSQAVPPHSAPPRSGSTPGSLPRSTAPAQERQAPSPPKYQGRSDGGFGPMGSGSWTTTTRASYQGRGMTGWSSSTEDEAIESVHHRVPELHTGSSHRDDDSEGLAPQYLLTDDEYGEGQLAAPPVLGETPLSFREF